MGEVREPELPAHERVFTYENWAFATYEMTDWRLQGQEKYLKGVALYWAKFAPLTGDWDHDHCEFCQGTFALEGGDFIEGYTTTDEHRWICQVCFDDFHDQFEWEVLRNP